MNMVLNKNIALVFLGLYLISCYFLQIFQPIETITTKISFQNINYIPSINRLDDVRSNNVVMGSHALLVIFIQWDYMFDFTVNR